MWVGGTGGAGEEDDNLVFKNQVYEKQQLPGGSAGPPRKRNGGAVNSNQAAEVLNSRFPSVFGDTPDATGLSPDEGETLYVPLRPRRAQWQRVGLAGAVAGGHRGAA